MSDESKDGDSDSRESYRIKISDLLKALARRKSLPCDTIHIDPRNISTTLSILKNTETGTFRSRAVLPENMSQLSKCEFKRQDHLSESLPASVPVPAPHTAVTSSQEGQLQPSLPSSNNVILAHLVAKSNMLPSDSVISIREQLKKQAIHPYILGVQAWTKKPSCEPQWQQHKVSQPDPNPGPTNKWFLENLTDLQKKLFVGASKKYGVPRSSLMPGKSACRNSSESTSLPPG
ncbi:uncharacterized protein LOC119020119 [Lates japonicus]|uniref:Uncharacterized protein n=1 Tax=Lates japonicus TaxID=270547 RepID=A0AAD3MHM7_LATJO|nr:uncharacterized protein AKAME5_000692100 [Lates japonicus]